MPKLADHARATRRTQILAAALTCFARSGYHTTTMADVAAEAGVSKGTPYLYFPSKEALYVTLFEEWDCALDERIGTTIEALAEDERRSPRRVLQAAVGAVGVHVTEQTATCRVLMEAHTLAAYVPPIAEVVKTAEDRNRQEIEHLVQEGMTVGEWPANTDPAVEARLITATLHGLMAQWHLDPGAFDWEAAAISLANPAGTRIETDTSAMEDEHDTLGNRAEAAERPAPAVVGQAGQRLRQEDGPVGTTPLRR